MPLLGAFVLPHPPVIIPAVGKGREKEIEETASACDAVAKSIEKLQLDTIVVISPHSVGYADYFQIADGQGSHGSLSKFGAQNAELSKEYDEEFVRQLSEQAQHAKIPAGSLGKKEKELDHGVLIPLLFVEQRYSDYRIVRVSISGLDALLHYRLGICIARTAEKLGRRTVLIASGDLSHRLKEDGPYGFAPQGPEFDSKLVDALANGDFLRLFELDGDLAEAAGECGLRSFFVLAGAFDGLAVTPKLHSYEGPFGIGYCVCSFVPGEHDESRCFDAQVTARRQQMQIMTRQNESEPVRLARLSLETIIQTGKKATLPVGISQEFTHRRAGTFVSLKKNGRLRGCIGTVSPTCDSIADEIMQNAISAGTQDPRFSPVVSQELEHIVYSVDLLGEAEPIESKEQLDPKKYGVIVSHGRRRGLLLPALEGINTVDEQISVALEKARISPSESYQLARFEVVRYK